ncbi:MAG: hypothetical protein A3H70_05005 [Candidatus Komeilibacteria bacterium RIFCSPLOWO2_02_FULL_48_11]|uniref:Uncharacterized protein n=1 Tax=Candidatus Komeilibacteria bacterium RIFCSPLOWO2_02_FULL_48_11 TaxID=1798553 RepID=A0A1G2BUH9_9BACT|nr:MAG: hypothetical protein A3H70_05005 [Candidatus Komeilibacteria bacterium RIFCSPLOWO2_02_FULL_48_11]
MKNMESFPNKDAAAGSPEKALPWAERKEELYEQIEKKLLQHEQEALALFPLSKLGRIERLTQRWKESKKIISDYEIS